MPGPVPDHGRAAGLQDLRRAKASTLRTAETVTVNVHAGGRRASKRRSPSAPEQTAIESNETHDRADDREQAHHGAAAERPPGLHAAAAHRRHALHADDVRRDRLLGHARVGRQRLALDSRQPHRQQRVPDRRRAELRAPAAAPATGTTRRRSTRSRSSRSATSSVDASFGRTSGGVVNMTLRSGTNQLRGSGILLHRGTWLDSNQIQNIRNNISNEGHKYYNGEGDGERADPPQQDVLHGRLPGLLREHPVPGDADGADRGAAARRLLADDHRQRHADPHLRPGDDARATRTSARARGSRSRATSFRRTAGTRSRRRCCRTSRRPNATPSNLSGSSNFINSPNVGRYRYNSYLTRIDHVFSDNHRLSFSNSGNWGIEFRNENALPEPAIRSDNYPTHRNHYLIDGRRQLTLNSTHAVEHARLVGPVRRAARQGLRRHRSEAAVHRARTS